jgi:hypothetical protein
LPQTSPVAGWLAGQTPQRHFPKLSWRLQEQVKLT